MILLCFARNVISLATRSPNVTLQEEEPPLISAVDEDMVDHLTQMGFPRDQVLIALVRRIIPLSR